MPTSPPLMQLSQSSQLGSLHRWRTDIDRFQQLSYSPLAMSHFWRAVALILVAIGSNCLGADEQTLTAEDGVLVLRNGFVLEGRITPLNDTYLVTIGTDGEVRLPRAEVEFQCGSLDEAYLHQRDAMIADDPGAHLTLADWCLRHRLLARAADQLLIAFVLDPGNSRLAALEHRLSSLASQSMPSAVEATPRVEPVIPLSAAPSKISPQLMQQFTTIVQPILLNRCAAYTCHGNGSSGSYRLIRPSAGHATTSRVTHRNLQATQSFIDDEHPENSRILAMGSVPHGGMKASSINEKHVQQWELVAAWIHRAAVKPRDSIVANSGGPKRLEIRRNPPAKPAIEPAHLSAKSPTAIPPRSAVVPAGHSEADATARTVSPAGPLPPTSQDPFDPEIFNQQYHPAKQVPR